jgi:hypothetical protein
MTPEGFAQQLAEQADIVSQRLRQLVAHRGKCITSGLAALIGLIRFSRLDWVDARSLA